MTAVSEVAPGIHRIESDLGPRFMAQYVLAGSERTVLVDTGLASTPGAALGEPDLVIVSHADVDHCGGNRALRERCPRARFACHAADRAWIESNAAMLAGNYLWYEPYGFGPAPADRDFIARELGGDAPVDELVGDGDAIELGGGWEVVVLHLPGHTPGHIGLWDERSGSALVLDAILERGVYDRAGTLLIPPRIYDTAGYRATIERVRALRPRRLLTAHFDLLEGDAVTRFLDRSAEHDDGVAAAVREGLAAGTTRLRDLTALADRRLGPYREFTHELAAAVRDHARRQGVEPD
jgi:glyoxylase-like metal-dependent hydrolase (beta-lactamase superfamily II)